MGWPREPRTPFGTPRLPAGDLPADVRALMDRADALLARYRAGELGREEMLRDPAYRKAAGAVGRALVADLLAHRGDLRLSDEWAAYRADPVGYGLDEEEPEGRGGGAPSGPVAGRGR